MGFSRQAWYQGCERERRKTEQDAIILARVQDIRLHMPRLGTRKLHHILSTESEPQLHIGRDSLFSLLRQARMLVVPRRAYHKTTNSHHRFYRHPNRLKPGAGKVMALKPEQVWVADITYLPTQAGMVYVSLVTDACSRKIVGYNVHESLHTVHVVKALKNALRNRKTATPLIHHSDRGLQYCSGMYQAVHEKHGLECSMTDGYDCYQNALAERVNGILKTEFLLSRPADLKEAKKMVGESVRYYNRERPHLSLKYKTPDAVHRGF